MNIQSYIPQIKSICDNHQVQSLYLFGSQVRGTSTEESDVDFVVRFGNVDLYNYFDNYMSLKIALEEVLHKNVDLVEEQTVKNPILRSSIEKNKQLIYG